MPNEMRTDFLTKCDISALPNKIWKYYDSYYLYFNLSSEASYYLYIFVHVTSTTEFVTTNRMKHFRTHFRCPFFEIKKGLGTVNEIFPVIKINNCPCWSVIVFLYTVHYPKVEHFLSEKSVPRWESVPLWGNVLFLDLFGPFQFLHYFTYLPIIHTFQYILLGKIRKKCATLGKCCTLGCSTLGSCIVPKS